MSDDTNNAFDYDQFRAAMDQIDSRNEARERVADALREDMERAISAAIERATPRKIPTEEESANFGSGLGAYLRGVTSQIDAPTFTITVSPDSVLERGQMVAIDERGYAVPATPGRATLGAVVTPEERARRVESMMPLLSREDAVRAFGEGSEALAMWDAVRRPQLMATPPLYVLTPDLREVAERNAFMRELFNRAGAFAEGRVRQVDPAVQARGFELMRRWRYRILGGLERFERRPCASCGATTGAALCSGCSIPTRGGRLRATPEAAQRWRERLYAHARTHAPVAPLSVPGGACASRRYPETRDPLAVKLRCPLRRSPSRAVCNPAPPRRCRPHEATP